MTHEPLVVAVLGLGEAGEQLRRLGVPPRVASASEQWLRQLAEEQAAGGAQRSAASSSP
jgi:hypothetical protein